ncbi:hypothetical protein KDK77_04910 [bacterium]|nr:hypothetical protein [bacterium]
MKKTSQFLAVLAVCASFTIFTALSTSACDTCGCSAAKHSHEGEAADHSMGEQKADAETQTDKTEEAMPEDAMWEEMEQPQDALDPQQPAE